MVTVMTAIVGISALILHVVSNSVKSFYSSDKQYILHTWEVESRINKVNSFLQMVLITVK